VPSSHHPWMLGEAEIVRRGEVVPVRAVVVEQRLFGPVKRIDANGGDPSRTRSASSTRAGCCIACGPRWPTCSANHQQFLCSTTDSRPNSRSRAPLSWLGPPGAARDPRHHVVEHLLPPGRAYAAACGHSTIFGCPHKLSMIQRGSRPQAHATPNAEAP
jgi:hypothetical protein